MFRYLRFQDGDSLPDIGYLRPFQAIVVIDLQSSSDWQYRVSKWLVESGCRFVLTWGKNCESWHDSVDWAHLKIIDFQVTDESEDVMTTWHDSEPLKEVFWFAKRHGHLPELELGNVLILHIGANDKRAEFEALYEKA